MLHVEMNTKVFAAAEVIVSAGRDDRNSESERKSGLVVNAAPVVSKVCDDESTLSNLREDFVHDAADVLFSIDSTWPVTCTGDSVADRAVNRVHVLERHRNESLSTARLDGRLY